MCACAVQGELDGKRVSQSATTSPCAPYRSAVIQRHHSYDRLTSSTNHYAKHFPTYSPPPSYRNTLLSASSATAPPFYPEPGPSTYHYGGTRPNQFRMPSARKSLQRLTLSYATHSSTRQPAAHLPSWVG